MSRFGQTGTFLYNMMADSVAVSGGTYIYLNAAQLPQYPFETSNVSDKTSYRAKSGRKWSYSNYNVRQYTFNWTMLDEGMRGSLKTMYDARPMLTFYSNGTNWGTYRLSDDSWSDSEAAFELYDLSFVIEEENSG